jgi:RNA polymerase sigma-70 factor (ECF subfamily)
MNAEELPDEETMARVVAGRSDLLERLVRRHCVRLLTFICRLIGDRQRGEELFQDVFLAVWTKRHQYQYPRPFRSWLYAIAMNKCREQLRRQPRPVVTLGEIDPPSVEPTPDEEALAEERHSQVLRAINRLSPQQRAVVMLRVWDELSYAEIAEVVGCTEGTVRSHMHLALAALRKELEPHVV